MFASLVAYSRSCCVRFARRSGAPAQEHRLAPRLGAVSFFHRFGSSLNVHPHYHLVVLDGVFSRADDSEIAFHEARYARGPHVWVVESGAFDEHYVVGCVLGAGGGAD
jgi:hypothetical protein